MIDSNLSVVVDTRITAIGLHLLHSSPGFSLVRFFPRHPSPAPLSRRFFTSSLPFPEEKAKYRKELEAVVEVVERACSLCVDVQRSLFSDEGRILGKKVIVTDFGVQALVSLVGFKSRFLQAPLLVN